MANLFTNGTEASLLHLILCDVEWTLCKMVLTTAFAEEACMVHGFTLQVQVARATRTL